MQRFLQLWASKIVYFLLLVTIDKVDVYVCASAASDMALISYMFVDQFFLKLAMNTMPVAHVE